MSFGSAQGKGLAWVKWIRTS